MARTRWLLGDEHATGTAESRLFESPRRLPDRADLATYRAITGRIGRGKPTRVLHWSTTGARRGPAPALSAPVTLGAGGRSRFHGS